MGIKVRISDGPSPPAMMYAQERCVEKVANTPLYTVEDLATAYDAGYQTRTKEYEEWENS